MFYCSAISKHVVRAGIVVEMGSHPRKRFLFNPRTPFSTKGLEKSLCDFTGTIFVQCENPVFFTVLSTTTLQHRSTREVYELLLSVHKQMVRLDCKIHNTSVQYQMNVKENSKKRR